MSRLIITDGVTKILSNRVHNFTKYLSTNLYNEDEDFFDFW